MYKKILSMITFLITSFIMVDVGNAACSCWVYPEKGLSENRKCYGLTKERDTEDVLDTCEKKCESVPSRPSPSQNERYISTTDLTYWDSCKENFPYALKFD